MRTLRLSIALALFLPFLTMFASFIFLGVDLNDRQEFAVSLSLALAALVSLGIWRLLNKVPEVCRNCPAQDLNEALELARVISEKGARHLRDVLNSMQTFIGVLTPEGLVLEVNETALAVVGQSMADVVGKKFEDTIWWSYSEESKQQIRDIVTRARAGERVQMELKFRNACNELRTVDFVMTPLLNSEGAVEFLIPSGVDVEARKSFEEQLIKSRMDAEIANQAKSAFLAHMSHELRSPLGIILGFVDFALEVEDPKEKDDHLETIRRNALQLLALVDEVLDLGKIESGRVSLDVADVRLDKLVAELQVSLDIKARERGIDLKFIFQPGTPTLLRTDSLRLKQILLNLVGNAVKYTDKGKVECTIRRLPGHGTTDPQIEFQISDTGIGISKADILRIFEPFARGRDVERKKYPGTGLGLALSKRLAFLLGGDVVLTSSQPGVGSTFTVTIAEALKVDETNRPTTWVSIPRTNGGVGRLSGMRLLVVDDVADNRILISKYLESEGATVVTASGGQEAITLGLQDGFHAILMDLSMPDMSGQEATSALRGKGYKIPIVALTAHAMREEKEKALQHGFNDYLTKPVVRDVLVEALSKIHQVGKALS